MTHKFLPYPNKQMNPGCIRCPWPRGHKVHDYLLSIKPRGWQNVTPSTHNNSVTSPVAPNQNEEV